MSNAQIWSKQQVEGQKLDHFSSPFFEGDDPIEIDSGVVVRLGMIGQSCPEE